MNTPNTAHARNVPRSPEARRKLQDRLRFNATAADHLLDLVPRNGQRENGAIRKLAELLRDTILEVSAVLESYELESEVEIVSITPGKAAALALARGATLSQAVGAELAAAVRGDTQPAPAPERPEARSCPRCGETDDVTMGMVVDGQAWRKCGKCAHKWRGKAKPPACTCGAAESVEPDAKHTDVCPARPRVTGGAS